MLINLGCGETKIVGAINCDKNIFMKPDVVCNLKENLPFRSESVEKISLIHVLEHLEKNHHFAILKEFNRILKQDGELFLAYPEFMKCAKNWIGNHQGKRDWWEKIIFGRQAWKEDYHVCVMNTEELVELLKGCGFGSIFYLPEVEESYNTFVIAFKREKPCEREDVFRQEIFQQ